VQIYSKGSATIQYCKSDPHSRWCYEPPCAEGMMMMQEKKFIEDLKLLLGYRYAVSIKIDLF
jgi:hypothetical protein